MRRFRFRLPDLTRSAFILLLAFIAMPCSADDADSEASWRRMFNSISDNYQLLRETDSGTGSELRLVDRPLYVWGRPQRQGSTFGAVYVWTHDGNAEAVACLWRYVNAAGQRAIVHEFHSLSPERIRAEGEFDSWKPRLGVAQEPISGSDGRVASTAALRLRQMRAIGREFELHSVSSSGDRVELRLLPQPFYRSQSTDPTILDGALFAFVCSVGTDPEAFLQLTARQTDRGPQWHWTLARFSHHNLYAEYQWRDVWSSERGAEDTMSHNADRTYWMFSQPFRPEMLEIPSDAKDD